MQNEQATQHYIRCQAGGAAYALPMLQIRSIERMNRLTQEAGANGQVGRLATANEQIPVYSLAQRVGQAPTAVLPSHRIIVLHHAEQAWGLLVDQVAQVAEVTPDQRLPLPESLQNGRSHFFSGVLKTDTGTALLLDPVQLHPDAEPPDLPTAPVKPVQRPAAAAPSGDKHIVIFSLPYLAVKGRPLSFGLSIAQVAEIIDPLEILPLASDSPYVQGLVQWRNQSVPLLQLYKPQKEEAKAGPNGRLRLLIVRAPETGALAALLVRANVRTVELPIPHRPSDRKLPIPPLLVSGCVELARETLVIPNIQAALA